QALRQHAADGYARLDALDGLLAQPGTTGSGESNPPADAMGSAPDVLNHPGAIPRADLLPGYGQHIRVETVPMSVPMSVAAQAPAAPPAAMQAGPANSEPALARRVLTP